MKGRNTTVLASLGAVVVMVALVAGSVPLYRLFCAVTGYGGTTQRAATPVEMLERSITVRFDANVMKDVPWGFKPEQAQMTLHLGETGLALFSAENHGEEAVVGTATFNVTPAKAGQYFNKIACFCFTEQRLEPGQRVDMPVQFFVDPALARDANTEEVTTITLSYTFFRAKSDSQTKPGGPPT